ncbi:hypothetical protein SAMN04515691_2078 [Leifsonia sp. 98AMF]|uniref:hypothetical protein n=1 Tax=unclassified Leifsonia TaxID=2663824 RepID=UPI00087BEA1A|nr:MULTISPECIES: hypothetical protein [unclassified Leifsonia]SDH30610.1 hypothetical protein SAMN04515690_1939 [Leifsonia sp. 197AMF]SDJ04604.1 hypothetical protein SAMN04515684_1845 [Leifsonia sp. 466MF]SDJ67865.1 hypothetical protein SAMN04515683_0899 [Leifsonia sp. 157MF]SDN24946.1 hypothetical protein SAMN04515686_0028 [Leifsonia sp. 509MF]SEM95462.1 hypothetical protein SAMN04515685_0887 [Leifsonia sp. 467MF]
MTSWPEQPPTGQPQTRRQAREFERSASRRAGTAEPTPGGQIPEMTTTVPPRASDEGAAAAGTAQQSEKPQAEAQGAEKPQSESKQAEPAAPKAEQAPAQPERPAIPASAFAEPGVSSPSRDAFDLFRQGPDTTQPEPVTQPMAILQPTTPPAAPASTPPASANAGSERTLTRRELRAMLQAQEANAQANHAPAAGEQVFPVSFTSGPEESGAKEGAAESGSSAPQAAAAAPAADPLAADPATPAPTSEKSAWPFAPLTPSSAPTASRSGQSETTVTQSSTSPFAAFGTAEPKADAPAVEAPSAPAPAKNEEPSETAAQERRPFTPPTGHWSTAAELDDQNQPIISRNVAQSTAATTTNALILPVIPQPDTRAPLTSTGEILVTGSIDLPRGMGATGAHPDRIDSSDLDRLLDGEENEFNTSEVQPVRASRAISTHTSTRGVIAPPKKRGNTLPVILMVTAGVLAVSVTALLVAAYVLKVF